MVGKEFGFYTYQTEQSFGTSYIGAFVGNWNFRKEFLNGFPTQIRQYVPNFFGRQKKSLKINPNDKIGDKGMKFIGNLKYDIGDDTFVTYTSFFYKNPRNLNNQGATRGAETVDAGINTLLTIAPMGKYTQSASRQVLNAAQYSKAYKNTIKLTVPHEVRGQMIKLHNLRAPEFQQLDKVYDYYSNGLMIFIESVQE